MKILVADDAQAERATARAVLTGAGYDVREAHDGLQALEVFTREEPALVMLDVVMPRMTGIEACRILKARSGDAYLPVLMVSTKNTVNARVEGLRSGADDFLGKPYDPEELLARVEVLLRTRAQVERLEESPTAPTGEVPDSTAPSGRPGAASGEGSLRTVDQGFRERLEQEFLRAERYSDPLACLKVRLDGVGEDIEVASPAARALREVVDDHVRKVDIPFGLDGRTCAVILPNTHFPGALAAAERIALAARRLQVAGVPQPSVSVGVSFFPNKDTRSAADVYGLVTLALQHAQDRGGGHICLYQHQGYLYVPEEG